MYFANVVAEYLTRNGLIKDLDVGHVDDDEAKSDKDGQSVEDDEIIVDDNLSPFQDKKQDFVRGARSQKKPGEFLKI